jgi:hypothetical protein
MWIRIVVMHFEGSALFWLQSVEDRLKHMSWEEFCANLSNRFGRDQHNLLIRQFYHIHQTTSVTDYVEQFDILLHQLLAHEGQLTPAMVTTRFIDGLRDEIRAVVAIQRPTELDTTCSLALLQEEVMGSAGRRETRKGEVVVYSKAPMRMPPMAGQSSSLLTGRNPVIPDDRRKPLVGNSRVGDQKLTALKNYRRARGLCFKCGEKWNPSHSCSNSVPLHVVEEMRAVVSHGEEDEKSEETNDSPEKVVEEEVLAVSEAAVHGGEHNKTIRLWAYIQGCQMLVLVDSGSSGSFMSNHFIEVVKGVQKLPHPLQVKVADGNTLWSEYWVPDCPWLCNGINFCADFKFLPLAGYDIVLGMDWLEKFNPMSIHWMEKWMEFEYQCKIVQLQGVRPKLQSCTLLSSIQLTGLIRQEAVEHVLELRTVTESNKEVVPVQIPPEIAAVIEKYQELFSTPQGLPPKRPFDHSIPLLPGATTFWLRPYRYTPHQKNEIERQIQEMLESGIIQQSSSPFASPVLLVKKKDGEWRLCVDYRRLNAYTVKNRFPMPVFDEITDELGGATIFTKLDHMAGYHQIRIQEGEEYKTAFQTHNGHYEYKVMPFGLTGAPATFQDFMNHILSPLLRKCVVVFLDDILVYSDTLEHHVQHLEQVFQILDQNQLKLKQSKCRFGQDTLEFLGHVISAGGISTDPAKVTVIKNWPPPRLCESIA